MNFFNSYDASKSPSVTDECEPGCPIMCSSMEKYISKVTWWMNSSDACTATNEQDYLFFQQLWCINITINYWWKCQLGCQNYLFLDGWIHIQDSTKKELVWSMNCYKWNRYRMIIVISQGNSGLQKWSGSWIDCIFRRKRKNYLKAAK